MGEETLDWQCCPIPARGKGDPQSLLHPSLMPALVARPVSCQGHTEKKKKKQPTVQCLLIWNDNHNVRGEKKHNIIVQCCIFFYAIGGKPFRDVPVFSA